MSAINGAFLEFKQQCDVEGKIITTYRSEKDFTIAIYCLEKNISVDKQRKKLFSLCKKHGVHYLSSAWDINFDVHQIISIKSIHNSTYLFIFLKKDNYYFSS